ncbi:hypothetical protein AMJ57_05000 [Parcubacteria bacterium SG8_24]|nr:MAG: hypothetical protein AMJ57_05000 [Parcubacteria bacterium SG8_24]
MTILTHLRPHLDDVCGIWLLRRYLPGSRDASIGFISTNEKVDQTDEDTIHVGVGRGRFDEHKGDQGSCAASLVLAFLEQEVGLPDGDRPALRRLVDWVLKEDTGQLNTMPHREFSVPVILKSYYEIRENDSLAVTELGFEILDALFAAQRSLVELEEDWKKRIEFDSSYGRGVGLVTDAREVDSYAYSRGFDLVVYANAAGTYHNVKARTGSGIDLIALRDKLKEREPEAGWYFHHSGLMLICGGLLAPDVKPSRLTVEEIVGLIKEI